MSHLFGSISAWDLRSPMFRDFMLAVARSAVTYLGPEYAVTEPGSWFISATANGAYQLVRGLDGELTVQLNVCPHYHKQIRVPKSDWRDGYVGKFNGGLVMCAGHLWVFNDRGGYDNRNLEFETKHGRCSDITTDLVPTSIGGMVWSGNVRERDSIRQLLSFPLTKRQGITHFIPPNYRLYRQWVDVNTFSPYSGMRIYEDMNHPGKGIHRGKLDSVVDMRDPQINYSSQHGASIQTVPWLAEVDYSTMSPFWAEYHRLAQEAVNEGLVPDDDTIGKVSWLAHYPCLWTHERYPFMLVNSWFLPTQSGGVRNVVEFYFPEEVLGFKFELAHTAVSAYMGGENDGVFIEGIAQEDARLALECDMGMDLLVQVGQGDRVIGPLDPVYDKAVYNLDSFFVPHWEKYKREKERRPFDPNTRLL